MEEAPPKRRVSKIALVPRRQPQRHSGAKRALEIGQMDFRPFVGECLYRTMVLTRSSLIRRKQSVVIAIVLCAVVCLSGLVLQAFLVGNCKTRLPVRHTRISTRSFKLADHYALARGFSKKVDSSRAMVQFSCTTVFSDAYCSARTRTS